MLRRINLIENEETSNRYVKQDKCVENEKKQQLIDMLKRIKVET